MENIIQVDKFVMTSCDGLESAQTWLYNNEKSSPEFFFYSICSLMMETSIKKTQTLPVIWLQCCIGVKKEKFGGLVE